MDFEVPDDRSYAESHEWARIDGDAATVGISDFAQDELGDVVFVELPAPGTELEQGEQFGVVESIKAVSDLYAPVSGVVSDVNDRLGSEPELVNEDPYGEAWMIEIELEDGPDGDSLLTDEEYRSQTE